jgi:hypothetical protein
MNSLLPAPSAAAAAVQSLDELFRKTTTLPALYFLPLTDAQADAFQARKKEIGVSDTRREPNYDGYASYRPYAAPAGGRR